MLNKKTRQENSNHGKYHFATHATSKGSKPPPPLMSY